MRQNDRRSITAAALLVPPLALMAWWIAASQQGSSQAESVERFLDPLPEFLQSPNRLSILSIVFCILAVVVLVMDKQDGKPSRQGLERAILVIAILLAAWNLFGML